jgi:hypothetical protein
MSRKMNDFHGIDDKNEFDSDFEPFYPIWKSIITPFTQPLFAKEGNYCHLPIPSLARRGKGVV